VNSVYEAIAFVGQGVPAMLGWEDADKGATSPSHSSVGGAATAQDDGTDFARLEAPVISLPKGGGAIRGIGETFTNNPATGTGSMSVPVFTSPGRAGVGPQLSLSYDSGSGNGPFGFGWSLSVPAITRKTAKGLPQYRDNQESDEFVLFGAEDLVPVALEETPGHWIPLKLPDRTVDGVTYRVERYRPRIEGLFTRIERWTNTEHSWDVCWRTISRDNVTTWFGRTPESRIAEPQAAAPGHTSHIYAWLVCESHDSRGNVISYSYQGEDSARIFEDAEGNPVVKIHENNRSEESRRAQRYLKRIRYGNRTAYYPRLLEDAPWPRPVDVDEVDGSGEWRFEVVLDYGDHDEGHPRPTRAHPWSPRRDPFSTYRAGFEVRTYRLCQRVLMFHHFPDDPGLGKDCLVRSTNFAYDVRTYSFLSSVTQHSYRKRGEAYDVCAFPPVELGYIEPTISETVEEVDPESLKNLPIGLDGATYRLLDVHGEGAPGILIEQADAWYYRRNLSPMPVDRNGEARVAARFAPLEAVRRKPEAGLGRGTDVMDLAGDGLPDVVVTAGAVKGLYEHDEADGWRPFRAFTSVPTRDLQDPNLRLVDLDGDGHADVLITLDEALEWHASLGEEGFGPGRRLTLGDDEEKGPHVAFADAERAIYLADMSGDGLNDICRIRNGEFCYWPNLGYARFGAKVGMDNAPIFDRVDQFDARRLRLADIDGTGTTDLVYLHPDGVRIYFNQSGNSWADEALLGAPLPLHDAASIQVLDLLGTGTACLVWSSPLPGDARRPLRYVNLMPGGKPHLLAHVVNNLGAETHVDYAPSTKFSVTDRSEGKPWVTRLPFPVHVVERVTTIDQLSRSRFVSRYAYHHGHYDGDEREFAGFALVERWDTETYERLIAQGAAANVSPETYTSPVHTRTWFHPGTAEFLRPATASAYAADHFREPGATPDEAASRVLEPVPVPNGLSVLEWQESARALRGTMLREEVYGLDGVGRSKEYPSGLPYTVTQQTSAVRVVQPRGQGRHAVFVSEPRETLTYHYERTPGDPRSQHSLVLAVDLYGNVLETADVGYSRRRDDATLPTDNDRAKQSDVLLAYTERTLTHPVDDDNRLDDFRTPVPSESRSYQVTGVRPQGDRFDLKDLRDRIHAAQPLPYEIEPPPGVASKRLVDHMRVRYRSDDLTTLLGPELLDPRALSGQSYSLAFTPGLLDAAYGDRVDAGLLTSGGYVAFPDEDGWWVPSGRSYYTENPNDDAPTELAEAEAHFFLPRRYRDPFGHDTTVRYHADLLVAQTRDPIGNTIRVEKHDLRLLQPCLVTDPNGNQTEVVFDMLGLVTGTAVMGKPNEVPRPGDSLVGFVDDVTLGQVDQLVAGPRQPSPDGSSSEGVALAHALLGRATTRIVYDPDRYRRLGEPALALAISRETHASELAPDHRSRLLISVAYSDGFGRVIQSKLPAEPGRLDLSDAGAAVVNPRWICSGWTVFDNKGRPVRQYEPFFTDTHSFETGAEHGVSSVRFYDPPGRQVATLYPDHSYDKVVFDSWSQTSYDANDTCAARGNETGDPRTDPDVSALMAGYFAAQPPGWETWYTHMSSSTSLDDREAASRAAEHADTPSTAHHDVWGRAFLIASRNRLVAQRHDLNGSEETLLDRVDLDIEGNVLVVRDPLVQADDPLGRVVVRQRYDMLGRLIHESGMDAGERRAFAEVSGQHLRAWDNRGHVVTTSYDALRRPVGRTVRGTTDDSDPRVRDRDVLVERVEYGEGLPGPETLNLRTRIYRRCDAAGELTHARLSPEGAPMAAYDFKGNACHGSRRFTGDVTAVADWSGAPALEAEVFASSTRYDALDRQVQAVGAHAPGRSGPSVVQHVFNEAGLLERVDVWLSRENEPDGLLDASSEPPSAVGVAGLDHDAKGQRLRIALKNGVTTSYTYDPLTFRMVSMETRRPPASYPRDDPAPADPAWPGRLVQNLSYTYDPVGNVTHMRDSAQQTVFFRNKRIEPSNGYVYDALYRLVQATGREHLGLLNDQETRRPPAPSAAIDSFHTGLEHPGDGKALGTYVENYVYDKASNFQSVQHRGTDPQHAGWTRRYEYLEPSLVQGAGPVLRVNNRLSKTTVDTGAAVPAPLEHYKYDAHGNVIDLGYGGNDKPALAWDFADRLRTVDLGGGGTAYYVYDGTGQRVRKVWVKTDNLVEDRKYLGDTEVFRKRAGIAGAVTLERETLHIMDDRARIALVENRTVDVRGADTAPALLVRYQHPTHLDSASLELDDRARVITYEEYSPYGSSTYQAVRHKDEAPKRYRFTGREQDEESGLSYHGARYYAPWLGRWISPDPNGLSDSVNLYCYVGCRPTVVVDPAGTQGHTAESLDDYRAVNSQRKAPLRDEAVRRLHAIDDARRHPKPHPPKKSGGSPKGDPGGGPPGGQPGGDSEFGRPGDPADKISGSNHDSTGEHISGGAQGKHGGTGKPGDTGPAKTDLDYAVLLAGALGLSAPEEDPAAVRSGGIPGAYFDWRDPSTTGQMAYIAYQAITTVVGAVKSAAAGLASTVVGFAKSMLINIPVSLGLGAAATMYEEAHTDRRLASNDPNFVGPTNPTPLPPGAQPYQLPLFPTEPYDRPKHYGTPKFPGAPEGQEWDHVIPVSEHWLKGEGPGSLPGFRQLPEERKGWAKDPSSGRWMPEQFQRKQGGLAGFMKRFNRMWQGGKPYKKLR
jgi:RHS repeat-associated protein